jgi:hypothetical protein
MKKKKVNRFENRKPYFKTNNPGRKSNQPDMHRSLTPFMILFGVLSIQQEKKIQHSIIYDTNIAGQTLYN